LDSAPELAQLRERLEAEEAAYAALLAEVDRLVDFPLPLERLPEQPEQMGRLNTLWRTAEMEPPGRAVRPLWRRVTAWLAPLFARQQDFNSNLVQVLNGQLEETARLHARWRELASTLVRYFQRLLPLVDARDRMSTAWATMRAELILEPYERRIEMLSRRIEGLQALRARLEVVGEELQALRSTLAAQTPPPAVADAALGAMRDSRYVAFENLYRGARRIIREHLADYLTLVRDAAPVVDLGCGRGEFLELLKDNGIAATGVDSNASCVHECRARGLDVVQADLLTHLRGLADKSLGTVFAAQVAEHLPPPLLTELLSQAFRLLRPGGLLLLETVNPRSVVGFLEVYTRDLTHERPLHPDTLRFLASAVGFTDVRVEFRAPVDPSAKLRSVPPEELPERTAQVLNENVARLNELIYGPQEYVLVAVR
jgi:SAM-dependent methyltransferase